MPASTGNWPTAKGRATKPLQNHPKTSKSPAEEKQTQKHRWAIRCISPFATGVYCLLDSCIPHESSPQIFGPVSNWQVQPNVADEHLGWRKTMNNLKMPTWKGENHPLKRFEFVCVHLSEDWIGQFHPLSKTKETKMSKNQTQVFIAIEAFGSLKEFIGFQHEICHQSWIQTIDEHNIWNLTSKNSPSSKRDLRHLTCQWVPRFLCQSFTGKNPL